LNTLLVYYHEEGTPTVTGRKIPMEGFVNHESQESVRGRFSRIVYVLCDLVARRKERAGFCLFA
jgi:hypothetical protein